ncbi:MAG: UPF0280 family protein [Desulfitobacterium sp.]|nr:UPF0280 family protein [Desulfitobacterium sp.]
MACAAKVANVGPMAAVAGAIAETLGKELSKVAQEVIIENGGDLYIQTNHKRIIGIFASRTEFSYKLGLEISGDTTPLGLCTSSGIIGSSISLGKADAVVIKAKTATLADAVVTATANMIQTPEDLEYAVKFAKKLPDVKGVLAIKGKNLVAWGDMKLVRI